MTDFNALPLDEKKKQAQAGDVMRTNFGATLIISNVARNEVLFPAAIPVSLGRDWTHFVPFDDIADIIRPTAREVPEEFLFPVLYLPSSKEPRFKFFAEINGRPWSACGFGATPAEALRAAIQAAKDGA